jgi:chemotaxis protein MotB
VLWIVGQSKAVRAGVAGYFRNPGVIDQMGRGILPGGDAGVSQETPPMLDPASGSSAGPSAEEQAILEKKAQVLRNMLARVPEFRSLLKQIEIQVTREGLRIELIETADSLFFDTGSAVLKPQTVKLLSAIAAELGSLDNPVIIEGHSDSRRYSASGAYSNWELSADRANSARRIMQEGGLHDGQITEVRGYADRRLRVKADPYDARNRRVSIIVSNQHAESSATGAGPSKPPAPLSH